MRRLALLACGFALLLGTVPEAQQPSAPIRPADQAIFRLSVSLVQLDAVVTDRQGRHVTTLGRDDFEAAPEAAQIVGRAADLRFEPDNRFLLAVLLDDERVDAISFTGSQATGRRVAQACAARGAKFQLEMGGKNPFVVLDDADLDVAVSCAVQSGFYSTGQRCTASSRVIVTAGIHDRFVAAAVEKMKALKVDDARKPGTDIGPVVDDRQLAQDLEYIAIGKAEGATLAAGGEAIERSPDGAPGYYLRPALFTDTTAGMRINREEIFGPVVSVMRARGYDEALALANDTPFGLSSGIATTSLKHATDFKRRAQAGMVMVNLPTAGVDYHVPFGGRKGSSSGPREQGRYAAEFYTSVKTAYTQA